MKSKLIISLGVIMATAVVVLTLHQRGFLWKKTLHLTSPPKICPVHGTQMNREMVLAWSLPLCYDPPYPMDEADEASRLFPCQNEWYNGGHPRNVGMFERDYCKECREGAQKWHANRRKAEQGAAARPASAP